MIFLIILGAILLYFIIRAAIDLAKATTLNLFIDKWANKTVWIWLPFHALKALWKEVNKK